MSTSTIVCDSSVIAKWFFPEEESQKALKIKEDFVAKIISIAVPLLLYWEINNLFKTATKTLRLNAKSALGVYEAFLKLNFVAYSSEELMKRTLKTAIDFDISSYDASYVALADYLQKPLFTADQKLLSKVESKFIFDLKSYGTKQES